MFRNREIRLETITYLGVTMLLSIAAFFFSPVASVLTAAAGLILTGVHLFFSKKRYDRIAELSDSLNRILLGQDVMLIDDLKEGELSILHSELHKMTDRLREQNDLLLQDKKNLTTAIEDIFHQLRTPMTAINLTVSLLSEEELSYERRIQLMHECRRQMERMSWLIDSLLKMSKIDSKSAVFRTDSVSVRELIQKAAEPFFVQMELRDIQFSMEIEDEHFQGDFLWSTEAFGNLLKNAVEHVEDGGHILVRAEETALYTKISVSDDGEGFQKEDLPHLFERFYKGKNASKNSIGIGLALARAIFMEQNGTITAENRPDGGAEFTVKLYKSIV